MNTKEISRNRYANPSFIFIIGIVISLFVAGCSNKSGQTPSGDSTQMWTCSMHPQIKQTQPGKCPICGMDLIPIKTSDSPSDSLDTDAISLSEEAMALANIQTTTIGHSSPVKEVRLYGSIQPNERLLRSQVSHVSGRIERLLVNTTGEAVRTGQVIASVYSPDLQNAQQELLEAIKLKEMQPSLLEAAREKLRLWKLSDAQISAIEQSGKILSQVDITANTSGIVITKNVDQGDYVGQGSLLFNIADLSSVWAIFDAYESDLPYLKNGDKVEYSLQALPGKTFSGKITFIGPVLDKTTRTVKIRVETANPGLLLKPEMYATAIIQASIGRGKDEIVVPKTAVLWTGKRSIVYVKQANSNMPSFKLREIELGANLGDAYVVLSGLSDGEEIVSNGAFAIDAGAQLEGKRSMMNNDSQDSKNTTQTEHRMLKVEGLCGMCKERIEKTAKSVDGVISASWDDESKMVHLNFDPSKASLNKISQAIAKVGHDTELHKADDKTYEALPDCCKYRE
jgi:Cu(I)/Ag(I) efflux system membrane fusion protein